MGGGEREGDLRFPLISSLFCLLVITGGVFLGLYAFSPDDSQPWFPIAALALIGSPFIFWFLTYLYTCFKACFRRSSRMEPSPSRARTTTIPRNASSKVEPAANNNNNNPGGATGGGGGGDEELGNDQVVMMQGGGGDVSSQGGKAESSFASRESETPLNLTVDSSSAQHANK